MITYEKITKHGRGTVTQGLTTLTAVHTLKGRVVWKHTYQARQAFAAYRALDRRLSPKAA